MPFKEGEKLAGIYFEDEQILKVGEHCDSIVVSMETGQMAYVPWFEVWKDGKIVSKWNAAKCAGVLYKQQENKK